MAAETFFELPLAKFVDRHRDKFPVVVQVRDGLYGSGKSEDRDTEVTDFSYGDYLELLRAVESINVTFDGIYDQPSHRGQITVPLDYEGVFQVVSNYSVGHVFKTANAILEDCIDYVYPQLQFEAQEVVVQPGDRLKVIKRVELPKGGCFLLCMHVRQDKNIMIPLDTVGHFEKKNAFPSCRLEDLLPHLPQRVRIVPDESRVLRGIGHGIEGLPDDFDGELRLSKVAFVEAYLWNSPGDVVKIPCSMDINVVPANDHASQFGDVCDIHTFIARQGFGDMCKVKVQVVITDDDEKYDMLGIAMDSLLQICGVRSEKGVLARGKKASFLLPANFKGVFKFKTQEYKTAIDLNESGCKEEVRVTHGHISADPRDDSLYVNDKVKLHCKELLIVDRIRNTSHEAHEIVFLDRTFSLHGHVGLVKVPTYAVGCFQPHISAHGAFTLDQVLSEKLPQTVTYVSSSTHNPEDHLKEGDTLTIYGGHEFNVAYVAPADGNNQDLENVKIIPDFIPVQIRPLRPDLPGIASKHQTVPVFQPQEMKVIKLRDNDFQEVFNSMVAGKGEYAYVTAGPNPHRKLPPPPDEFDGDYSRVRSQSVQIHRPPAPLPFEDPLQNHPSSAISDSATGYLQTRDDGVKQKWKRRLNSLPSGPWKIFGNEKKDSKGKHMRAKTK